MRSSDQIDNNVITKSHDKDIYSSYHDEILCWSVKQFEERTKIFDLCLAAIKQKKLFRHKDKAVFKDILIQVEDPIYYNSKLGYAEKGKPAGFIDLKISFVFDILYTEKEAEEINDSKRKPILNTLSWLKKSSEEKTSDWAADQIEKENKKLEEISLLKAGDVHYSEEVNLCIEIKTAVNLGETIRQIKYYSGFCSHNCMFMVIAPRFGQEQLLKSQGIGFIAYDPENKAFNTNV